MGDEEAAAPIESTPPTLPEEPTDDAMEPNAPLPTTPE